MRSYSRRLDTSCFLKKFLPDAVVSRSAITPLHSLKRTERSRTSNDEEDGIPPVRKNNSKDDEAGGTDALSQRGAIALAKRLQRFWHEQGYPAARFWAEPIEERFPKVGTYVNSLAITPP
jgi:hypothetical protein